MNKRQLSEMTLKELWELFPIFLTEHNEDWASWYEEEITSVISLMPDTISTSTNHIGSTAIPAIWAKPIVDILMEVDKQDMKKTAEILSNNGYIQMNESPGRIDFNKGYTPSGFAKKVFHLHLRENGDNDEIYFRDCLNAHPDIAKAYEKLKLELWKKYEHDRDGYTDAKSEFVGNVLDTKY